MDIVIAFNEAFVVQAGVMLCSLFENNKAEDIRVHALLSQESTFAQPVIDIVKQYGGHIQCYDLRSLNLPSLPIDLPNQRPNLVLESYYRLFVSEVIPSTLDRVLYLDCDIIIADSLSSLWNEDISDYAVGAVPDFENNNVKFSNRLGYDTEFGYFNSGVLLINLNYWREHGVVRNYLDYIKNNYFTLPYHDQDVLNHEFYQHKKELPIRYNLQTNLLFKDYYRNISCKYFNQINEAFKHPCVIHFTEDKPWFSDTTNPMYSYYKKYLDLTIWRDLPPIKRKVSYKSRIRHFISLIRGKSESEGLYNNVYL